MLICIMPSVILNTLGSRFPTVRERERERLSHLVSPFLPFPVPVVRARPKRIRTVMRDNESRQFHNLIRPNLRTRRTINTGRLFRPA